MSRPIFLLFFCAFLLLLSGCVPNREMIFFQDRNKPITEGDFRLPEFTYKVQTGDILSIDIVSPDAQATAIFEKESQNRVMPQAGNSGGNIGFYLTGYTIDVEGNIALPLLGKVHVAGMSVDEVNVKLQEIVDEEMNETTVFVKLVNYKISVLGEVNMQGIHYFYLDRVTILDALGAAGGMTEFANRRRVRVIRTEANQQSIYTIDLTDRSSLTSKNYFLRPNDVVLIDPLKARGGRMNLPLLTTVLSTTTTLIVVVSFILRQSA